LPTPSIILVTPILSTLSAPPSLDPHATDPDEELASHAWRAAQPRKVVTQWW
jgi:hypothetical protein